MLTNASPLMLNRRAHSTLNNDSVMQVGQLSPFTIQYVLHDNYDCPL